MSVPRFSNAHYGGGNFTIASGDTEAAEFQGGSLIISGGRADGGVLSVTQKTIAGGNITMQAGVGAGEPGRARHGTGGATRMTSGYSNRYSSGAISITTSDGESYGSSGNINLTTGALTNVHPFCHAT